MKNNWINTNLGKVIELAYGKPLDKGDRDKKGIFPVYGANGIKVYSNKYLWDKPSIVVGRKGSAGELTLVSTPFWPLDVTFYIKYDDSLYDINYLFYLLRSLNLKKLAKGVKPGINRNDVYAIAVSVPPLVEQQRLVAIILETESKVNRATINAERSIEILNQLKVILLNNAIRGEL